MDKSIKTFALRASLLAALCAAGATQAATIVVTSRDPAGVGFNDTTPVAPVGGNPGTTLGEQRRYVYRYVADIWETQLDSDVTITVNAAWEALTCTASSATLGSASAWNIWHDFPNGKPGTWYPQALANKLAGYNLTDGIEDDGSGYGNVDIKTQFNVNLGKSDCLDGSPFYLGVDGNAGTAVNFVETLLHELGHGLGFSVLTVYTGSVSSAVGYRLNADGTAYQSSGGLPSVWEQYMYDNTAGKTWLNMTSAERRVSTTNALGLAWIGPQAVAGAATTLTSLPVLKTATSAPGYSGFYAYNTASFGPSVATGLSLGALAVTPTDLVNGGGCLTFDAATAAAVAGKVAIIDRGVCGFAVKAKNAQNAGAIGVIIANNTGGAAPGLGGSDPTVVIPTISVSQADGATLKAAVAAAVPYGTRKAAGLVSASLAVDASRRAGADALGRPLLYTPSTLASGSSVSHWDVSAFPNLLMEPNINSDLTTILVPPKDLTRPLLKDIGW
ncbi:PA domain-containing protein [Roseateles sp. YR242]|uniref:PA domain-containing protein n=1 Tax=Roseateles sp. YR242 TaxID=1855305 RepID=UPI0008B513D2|nr:PA domain-containing protein [Roseateles sp. YR242]SEL83782.1 PA domain-containing protein [Roseateles sp. YR242]